MHQREYRSDRSHQGEQEAKACGILRDCSHQICDRPPRFSDAILSELQHIRASFRFDRASLLDLSLPCGQTFTRGDHYMNMSNRWSKTSPEIAQTRVREALEQDPKGFAFLSKLEVEQSLDEKRRGHYIQEGAPHGWLGPKHTYDMRCKPDCPPDCSNPECLRPRFFARRGSEAA